MLIEYICNHQVRGQRRTRMVDLLLVKEDIGLVQGQVGLVSDGSIRQDALEIAVK